jgi:hypothetical protein
MTGTPTLAHAQLVELDELLRHDRPGGKSATVQFNPESLKLSFANSIVQPGGGDQAAGTSGRQFVGAGTTKLALSLWFDVTAMAEPVDDVRRLTADVIHFMTPAPDPADAARMVPPGTSFRWGSFRFDGIVENLEETLDFFSADGKPLRASVALTLGQQKILATSFEGDGRIDRGPGTQKLTAARSGDSLQTMAMRGGVDWKVAARLNGIEDPLNLAPGQLINLDVRSSANVSGTAGIGTSIRLPGGR